MQPKSKNPRGQTFLLNSNPTNKANSKGTNRG